MPKITNFKQKLVKFVTVLTALSGLALNAGVANAATLTSAKVDLSDPSPSATSVSYTFTGSNVTNTVIKCVQAVFANASTGQVNPTGWSGASGTVTATSSTLINSSASGWSLATSDGSGASAGSKNVWQYTNTTGVTPSTLTGATFVMAGITNASTANTAYYLHFNTYSDSGCATPVDSSTVEFINTNGSTLSLTIDNTLSFTVNAVAGATSCDGTTTTQASTATTIPFGTVTSVTNGVVCQDLTAATNATNGYTIYARYTSAPTNAIGQTIADTTGTNSTPAAFSAAGTEAYGYTTNDATLGTGTANRFTNPSQGWAKMTTANAEVAYESAGVNSTTYRIGHQVGVSTLTKPGTYTTTVIYTCTPVF